MIPVFVVAVLSFLFRIVIRIRFQRSLSVDDGFLAAGMVCLAFAFAALFAMLDDMFRVEALAQRSRALLVQDDDFPHMASFARWGLAYNVLLWTAACCVKFSFLALFRKLLDPTKWVRVYWWITTVFAGLTYLYGIAAFLLLCPYHYSLNPRRFYLQGCLRDVCASCADLLQASVRGVRPCSAASWRSPPRWTPTWPATS